MKTQIIYQDEHILVCHKPAGIAVQSARIGQQDMESELKNYLDETGHNKGNPYLGVIHRLDQPVSGILVFAKNQKAAASLSAQIQDGRAKKIYRALVWGTFEEKSGTLEHLLYKDAKTNLSRAVQANAPEAKAAKKAKLNYKILKEIEVNGEVCSEAEIELFTGRHHQIRVQFSQIGHPLMGDVKYGSDKSKEISDKMSVKSLKLCAAKLSFLHPQTQKYMEFAVECLPW